MCSWLFVLVIKGGVFMVVMFMWYGGLKIWGVGMKIFDGVYMWLVSVFGGIFRCGGCEEMYRLGWFVIMEGFYFFGYIVILGNGKFFL